MAAKTYVMQRSSIPAGAFLFGITGANPLLTAFTDCVGDDIQLVPGDAAAELH